MKENDFINISWELYQDGFYQNSKIEFLPNGVIKSNGAEGFFKWNLSNNLLNIVDNKGFINYILSYNEDSRLLINTISNRNNINDVFLAKTLSDNDIRELFPHHLIAQKIAHRSASYRSPKGDVWGVIFFGIDGRIYHYHNENEYSWKIIDEKFRIFDKEGNETLQLKAYSLQKNNELVDLISMQHVSGGTHYLEFSNTQDDAVKKLHTDICLSNKSKYLIVIFNSAGYEYDGCNTRFEFYKYPYLFGSDYIRFSQSSPSRWYLDDEKLIRQLVSLNQYETVVLIGMSVGGYSAMWFAEMLAKENPLINYISFPVQALSSLETEYLKEFRAKFSSAHDIRSKTPTDSIIDGYKGLVLDIRDFLSEKRDNAKHYVIYDALNDAEAYNSVRLLDSDRVMGLAIPYQANHSIGCQKIYSDEILIKIINGILLST